MRSYKNLNKQELIRLLEIQEPKENISGTSELLGKLRNWLTETKPEFTVENLGMMVLDAKNNLLDVNGNVEDHVPIARVRSPRTLSDISYRRSMIPQLPPRCEFPGRNEYAQWLGLFQIVAVP